MQSSLFCIPIVYFPKLKAFNSEIGKGETSMDQEVIILHVTFTNHIENHVSENVPFG